ncbi:unnamed protein product, partial [Coregonus sp. 'balchen']
MTLSLFSSQIPLDSAAPVNPKSKPLPLPLPARAAKLIPVSLAHLVITVCLGEMGGTGMKESQDPRERKETLLGTLKNWLTSIKAWHRGIGAQGPPGDVGLAGPKGERGEPGDAGGNSVISHLLAEIQQLKARQANLEKEGLKFCNNFGVTMAIPRNDVENQALSKFIVGASYGFLGATDRKTEGVWVDLNDEPLTYLDWRSGEPNSG